MTQWMKFLLRMCEKPSLQVQRESHRKARCGNRPVTSSLTLEAKTGIFRESDAVSQQVSCEFIGDSFIHSTPNSHK